MTNLRAAALMVAAMAGFALEDALIKRLAQTVPTGQILVLLGIGGAAVFAVLARMQGASVWDRRFFSRAVMLRNLGEGFAALFMVTSLALLPLSLVSAILQALPLLVTMLAALFMGERVGWRRWTAIGVGFAGMLLIVRPGAAGFDPAAIIAVVMVLFLALRDLATRRIGVAVRSVQIAAWGFLMVVPAGGVLLAAGQEPVPLTAGAWVTLAGVLALGVVSYWAITAATRGGDIAFVAPFRYTRLVFALAVAWAMFGEVPDGWTLAGAALIVASGLYTFARERQLSLRAQSDYEGRGSNGARS